MRRLGTQAADEPAGARPRAIATALWPASRKGIVDVLGSDHAPHTLEEKAQALSARARPA